MNCILADPANAVFPFKFRGFLVQKQREVRIKNKTNFTDHSGIRKIHNSRFSDAYKISQTLIGRFGGL